MKNCYLRLRPQKIVKIQFSHCSSAELLTARQKLQNFLDSTFPQGVGVSPLIRQESLIRVTSVAMSAEESE